MGGRGDLFLLAFCGHCFLFPMLLPSGAIPSGSSSRVRLRSPSHKSELSSTGVHLQCLPNVLTIRTMPRGSCSVACPVEVESV